MISHGSKKDGQRDKHTAGYLKGIHREVTMGSFGLSSTTLLHLSHIDDRDASHFTHDNRTGRLTRETEALNSRAAVAASEI